MESLTVSFRDRRSSIYDRKSSVHKAASKSGFVPPNKEKRDKALGDISKEDIATRKALANLDAYYEPIRPP